MMFQAAKLFPGAELFFNAGQEMDDFFLAHFKLLQLLANLSDIVATFLTRLDPVTTHRFLILKKKRFSRIRISLGSLPLSLRLDLQSE